MVQQAVEVFERHRAVVLGLVIAGVWALAWSNRFIQDDAFISFRYAQNLADGLGLTWNPGERIEGYTNFLWTLVMTIPFLLGSDPVPFSMVSSWLLFPASLFLTARIARKVTDARWAPLVAVVLLGTNYTFSAYATGGLETQLHTFLLLGVLALALRSVAPTLPALGDAIGISLLSAAALMTRMDSALFLAVIYGYIALEQYANVRRDPRSAMRPTWGGFNPIQVSLTECLLSDIAENAACFAYLRKKSERHQARRSGWHRRSSVEGPPAGIEYSRSSGLQSREVRVLLRPPCVTTSREALQALQLVTRAEEEATDRGHAPRGLR